MNEMRTDTNFNPVKEEVFNLAGKTGPDWRIWLGLTLTTAWLLLLSIYVAAGVGWVIGRLMSRE